jgi:YggT family protein
MDLALTVVRYLVFAAFTTAVGAAVGSWLVRTRRVNPFGPLGQRLRRWSDVLVKPVEGRLLRAGGNPVNAGWWLVVGAAVGGILIIGAAGWLIRTVATVGWATRGGPRAMIAVAVNLAYNVVFFALLARVIGTWIGVGRYSRWLRPAYWLTDWVIEPLRRVLPPFGMFDLSPLVAIFVLWTLRAVIFAVLL